jgi:hypothetical protein
VAAHRAHRARTGRDIWNPVSTVPPPVRDQPRPRQPTKPRRGTDAKEPK